MMSGHCHVAAGCHAANGLPCIRGKYALWRVRCNHQSTGSAVPGLHLSGFPIGKNAEIFLGNAFAIENSSQCRGIDQSEKRHLLGHGNPGLPSLPGTRLPDRVSQDRGGSRQNVRLHHGAGDMGCRGRWIARKVRQGTIPVDLHGDLPRYGNTAAAECGVIDEQWECDSSVAVIECDGVECGSAARAH